jgi:hypothetical protein
MNKISVSGSLAGAAGIRIVILPGFRAVSGGTTTSTAAINQGVW